MVQLRCLRPWCLWASLLLFWMSGSLPLLFNHLNVVQDDIVRLTGLGPPSYIIKPVRTVSFLIVNSIPLRDWATCCCCLSWYICNWINLSFTACFLLVLLQVWFEILILAKIECGPIFKVRSALRLLFYVLIEVWCRILFDCDLNLGKIPVPRVLGHFFAHFVIIFVSFPNLYYRKASWS